MESAAETLRHGKPALGSFVSAGMVPKNSVIGTDYRCC